jgi:hypothetical protein
VAAAGRLPWSTVEAERVAGNFLVLAHKLNLDIERGHLLEFDCVDQQLKGMALSFRDRIWRCRRSWLRNLQSYVTPAGLQS